MAPIIRRRWSICEGCLGWSMIGEKRTLMGFAFLVVFLDCAIVWSGFADIFEISPLNPGYRRYIKNFADKIRISPIIGYQSRSGRDETSSCLDVTRLLDCIPLINHPNILIPTALFPPIYFPNPKKNSESNRIHCFSLTSS